MLIFSGRWPFVRYLIPLHRAARSIYSQITAPRSGRSLEWVCWEFEHRWGNESARDYAASIIAHNAPVWARRPGADKWYRLWDGWPNYNTHLIVRGGGSCLQEVSTRRVAFVDLHVSPADVRRIADSIDDDTESHGRTPYHYNFWG